MNKKITYPDNKSDKKFLRDPLDWSALLLVMSWIGLMASLVVGIQIISVITMVCMAFAILLYLIFYGSD